MSKQESRVALVTGASSGIGRACAAALVRSGFRVYGTSRYAASENAATNGRLKMISMDVDDASSVRDAVSTILEETGRIDVLVNCAGFGIGGAVEETSDREASRIFETNLFGVLRVCQAVLPTMRERRSGWIVNISSIGGRIGLPFQGLYSATKFAVEGLSEALRMETRRFGVRVVLIEPGDFSTGFTDRRAKVKDSGPNSVYAEAFSSVLAVVEKDERAGATPEIVGRLVARIVRKKSPRTRYLVGPAMQRLAVRLKGVLPSRVFEWVLRTYYRVGSS